MRSIPKIFSLALGGPIRALPSLKQLRAMPTLCVGHFDDLKYQQTDPNRRIWLSRCTVEDGEPYDNKVTIERLENGLWVEHSTYQAR